MCLPVITSRNFIPAAHKGTDCDPWNHLSVCGSHASSSLWRGKLCLPACDARLQFPHSGLISDFNEGFHIFGLHDTICDSLVVTVLLWLTHSGIYEHCFSCRLINAVFMSLLCGCFYAPTYLFLWYVISTVVRISVTCLYTAWHFSHFYMWNMWKLPTVKPKSHGHPDVNFTICWIMYLHTNFRVACIALDAKGRFTHSMPRL